MDQRRINYNPETKEGRSNIIRRIFEDSKIEFKEEYLYNSEHWTDKLFNGGRKYQRKLDEDKIDAYFNGEAQRAKGGPETWVFFTKEEIPEISWETKNN